MSTRSVIINHYENENCFKSIYCHYDGYPEGVGQTLKDNYICSEKINNLINGGDISSLDDSLEGTSLKLISLMNC